MDILTVIGIALILWGAATILVAVLKPKSIWKTGKIQGFVQVLSERGAVIFFIVVGLLAVLAGIMILL
jgi:hypothetical protein